MTPQQVLAQPLTLRNGVVLKNRIAKSAMSEQLGTTDNNPTPGLETLYRTWAEGGLGLCITGNVMVDRRAIGEHFRLEPEPLQVPNQACGAVVLVRRPRVQHVVVVHELDVARTELHVQIEARVVGEIVEQVQRLDLLPAEARRIGEALRTVDVLALVNRTQLALVPVEDRDLEIGLHAGRNLAAPVGGERLHQEGQQVGARPADLVVDRA